MLLSLPDEILLKILKLLRQPPYGYYSTTKHDVLSCRLACRRLSRIGDDIVFEDILLTPDATSRQAFVELSCSPLSQKIKTLHCYYEVFDQQLATLFDKRTVVSSTPTFILNQLKNLRRITLLQSCAYGVDNEDGLFANNPSDLTKSPVAYSIFEHVVGALSQSGPHIEQLTVGYFDEQDCPNPDDFGLVSTMPNPRPMSYPKYEQAFGHLRRLRISLPRTMADDENLDYTGLSTLISAATTLEDLYLCSSFQSRLAFPINFLRSNHISKLTTIVLENFLFKESADLLTFLRMHATTLHHLGLFSLVLERGAWEDAIIGIRDWLSVQSCSVQELLVRNDGNDEDICATQISHSFYKALGSFIEGKVNAHPFHSL
ncbi:hypothetical protein F5Y17DRAFT_450509 [Xylariaceae sp. FL0594]|nr:hypothetical protein F5Y17DRAFT_450509 [Xylariaceae sp. FL0594]